MEPLEKLHEAIVKHGIFEDNPSYADFRTKLQQSPEKQRKLLDVLQEKNFFGKHETLPDFQQKFFGGNLTGQGINLQKPPVLPAELQAAYNKQQNQDPEIERPSESPTAGYDSKENLFPYTKGYIPNNPEIPAYQPKSEIPTENIPLRQVGLRDRLPLLQPKPFSGEFPKSTVNDNSLSVQNTEQPQLPPQSFGDKLQRWEYVNTPIKQAIHIPAQEVRSEVEKYVKEKGWSKEDLDHLEKNDKETYGLLLESMKLHNILKQYDKNKAYLDAIENAKKTITDEEVFDWAQTTRGKYMDADSKRNAEAAVEEKRRKNEYAEKNKISTGANIPIENEFELYKDMAIRMKAYKETATPEDFNTVFTELSGDDPQKIQQQRDYVEKRMTDKDLLEFGVSRGYFPANTDIENLQKTDPIKYKKLKQLALNYELSFNSYKYEKQIGKVNEMKRKSDQNKNGTTPASKEAAANLMRIRRGR